MSHNKTPKGHKVKIQIQNKPKLSLFGTETVLKLKFLKTQSLKTTMDKTTAIQCNPPLINQPKSSYKLCSIISVSAADSF
jgi:hypothetical protein